MLRHLPQPLNPGVLHRGIGIQPFGHGMADHRLAFFFEQGDELLLFVDQGIDFGGFVVEEVGDLGLFKYLGVYRENYCRCL